jgi:orotidine-5'-phosphate decarboxylase
VPGRPKLWGITVLTSFDEASFSRVGFRAGTTESVDSLAALARECGLDGVVASPNEAARLRAALGPAAEIITPGIRRAAGGDDQKRTMTPREAAAAGADYIVVGRPVIAAADPAAEAAAILEEIK